ncbi:dnaJ homolog subfamily C member 25 homolog [Planococcus citri]|uniref:dnaJ homolog subfamily C member 25 homolog n=1 Tax=Planococcus citri TaxID=170843 RepID=UPI0031F999D4
MAPYRILFLGITVFLFHQSEAMIDELYCGRENCYEILGVAREATKVEISKSYRQLAKKYHPDMHKTAEAKETAAETFRKLANAYEILKDEESRTDYDFMLDHPDQVYSHYYRYYRRRMTPRVDVRIVVAVTLTVISAVQYFLARQRYYTAISYLVETPKYRLKALEEAKALGLLSDKKNKTKSKAEIKEETENVIRKVLEDNMDIRGGYAKPKFTDILLCQLVLLPVGFFKYICWFCKWIWKYNICKEEYGEEEKLYLIRKNMKMKEDAFDQYTDVQKKEFLKQELWIYDNYKKWQDKKDEEMKKRMAENGRYKAYRRYMRQHGPGRIVFDDS